MHKLVFPTWLNAAIAPPHKSFVVAAASTNAQLLLDLRGLLPLLPLLLLLLGDAPRSHAQAPVADAPKFSFGIRTNAELGPGLEFAYRLSDRAQATGYAAYRRSGFSVGFGLDTSQFIPQPSSRIFFRNASRSVSFALGGRFYAKPGLFGFFIAPSLGVRSSSEFSDEVTTALARSDRFVNPFSASNPRPNPYPGTSLLVLSEAGYRLGLLRHRVYLEISGGLLSVLPNPADAENYRGYLSLAAGVALPTLFKP